MSLLAVFNKKYPYINNPDLHHITEYEPKTYFLSCKDGDILIYGSDETGETIKIFTLEIYENSKEGREKKHRTEDIKKIKDTIRKISHIYNKCTKIETQGDKKIAQIQNLPLNDIIDFCKETIPYKKEFDLKIDKRKLFLETQEQNLIYHNLKKNGDFFLNISSSRTPQTPHTLKIYYKKSEKFETLNIPYDNERFQYKKKWYDNILYLIDNMAEDFELKTPTGNLPFLDKNALYLKNLSSKGGSRKKTSSRKFKKKKSRKSKKSRKRKSRKRHKKSKSKSKKSKKNNK